MRVYVADPVRGRANSARGLAQDAAVLAAFRERMSAWMAGINVRLKDFRALAASVIDEIDARVVIVASRAVLTLGCFPVWLRSSAGLTQR